MKPISPLLIIVTTLLLSACEGPGDGEASGAYASRYQPLPSVPTLLRGGTVLTGTGERLDGGDLVM
ncbi:MAG: amidohydrolase, partial [Woeseiaceae bacterium]